MSMAGRRGRMSAPFGSKTFATTGGPVTVRRSSIRSEGAHGVCRDRQHIVCVCEGQVLAAHGRDGASDGCP